MKFCPKCKCETERQTDGDCKPCMKISNTAKYAANKEKIKAKVAAYQAQNPDKRKATGAAYYASNKEKFKEFGAAYYAKNVERIKVRAAAYRASNQEKIKASNKKHHSENSKKRVADVAAWRIANPEASKARRRIDEHSRRARKHGDGGKLSKGLSAKLFKLQKGKCACCGLPLEDNYHQDHVMPIALGGSNTDDNMQLLRATCNLQKSSRHPVEFMQGRGFLL